MERMSYENENENYPNLWQFSSIFNILRDFHSVYVDCWRLQEIVKDLAYTFQKLLKIACPIVKNCIRLILILATHSLCLILHDLD